MRGNGNVSAHVLVDVDEYARQDLNLHPLSPEAAQSDSQKADEKPIHEGDSTFSNPFCCFLAHAH